MKPRSSRWIREACRCDPSTASISSSSLYPSVGDTRTSFGHGGGNVTLSNIRSTVKPSTEVSLTDGDTFNETDIATIDRAHSHLIRFSIDFKNAPAQDTVKICIDGVLKITGTTWEDYYRYDSEQASQGNKVPTVDKMLFLERGATNVADAGQGFLIDHVSLASSGAPKKKS